MSEPTHHPEGAHRLEQQRRENRDAVRVLGLDPYGSAAAGVVSLADARAKYDEQADALHKERGPGSKAPDPAHVDRRPVVQVAGRVMLHRDNGKLIWLNLRDDTGDLQVAVSQRDCVAPGFDLAKLTDLGDVVVATGPLVRTRTGEVTVWAAALSPAAKCLVPPPEKHAGLQDPELRYRQRYVDMWATPETMEVFRLRSRIVTRLRRFLDARGFLEVETPVLQTLAGGAAARPFVTHMNALDLGLFMRVAPELFLKRLLVGGMPRVYEVARNFRNEGVDRTHNPEFTMVEVYEAYGDYHTMMELTEGLIRDLAAFVVSQRTADAYAGEAHDRRAEPPEAPGEFSPSMLLLPFGEHLVDYGSPFLRVRYAELFERVLGFAVSDTARARREVRERGLARKLAKGIPDAVQPPGRGEKWVDEVDPSLIVQVLFDEVAEKSLDPARPTFVLDYPAALCPLTRPKAGDPGVAERFELFIGGSEIANAYTELNDPDVQERKFREQLAGLDEEESTFRTFDEDFIRALKVGMPPAGGLGVGVDRLVMLLANQRSIRDVLLFPLMRPAPGA